MRAGPCARNSGGQLRPSTGPGHDPFDDAEGIQRKGLARTDPRDTDVVSYALMRCLPPQTFL